jgi:cell division septal protein FtsQ
MHRFRLVYERALQDQLERVRYVDARYANGVAVRWEETLVAYGGETQHGI